MLIVLEFNGPISTFKSMSRGSVYRTRHVRGAGLVLEAAYQYLCLLFRQNLTTVPLASAEVKGTRVYECTYVNLYVFSNMRETNCLLVHGMDTGYEKTDINCICKKDNL